MMNGHGKSDRPVVPAKSPNNAGQPAAEGMEERGLAKGNPPRQNALRTPSRAGAPSALERIRQAARKDRKTRFTALLHHVYNLDTLREAYFCLKRDAAPGVDGQTWRAYGVADGLIDSPRRVFASREGGVWIVGAHDGAAATAATKVITVVGTVTAASILVVSIMY